MSNSSVDTSESRSYPIIGAIRLAATPRAALRADPGSMLALLWTIAVALLLFTLLHQRGFDDPYITYRYTVNIAQGHGFVYNHGERVLSTTAPGYALLLVPAAWLGLPIPLVSNALGCLSLALGGLAFWLLGKTWKTYLLGSVGLILYPLCPLLLPTLGAETCLYVTLVLYGFLFYARGQLNATALMLAAAILVRADAVLAGAVMGLHFLIERRSPFPWRALIICGMLLLPWFVFAWLYFGAPLPVTLGAKQRQGMMAISQGFFEGLLALLRGYWRMPFYHLHVLVGLTGLIAVLARRPAWAILQAWNGVYIAAYTALGVTRYFWYYGPLAVGVVVLIATGVMVVYRLTRRVWRNGWAQIGIAVLLLALFLPQAYALYELSRVNDQRLPIYRTVGQWLYDQTPEEASVGTLEVGIIGYYAQRHMIDFAGLIQPETALQLGAMTTYEDAARWSFEHFRPDYLVLQEGHFSLLEQNAAFQAHCRPRETFEHAQYRGTLVVYECAWRSISGKHQGANAAAPAPDRPRGWP